MYNKKLPFSGINIAQSENMLSQSGLSGVSMCRVDELEKIIVRIAEFFCFNETPRKAAGRSLCGVALTVLGVQDIFIEMYFICNFIDIQLQRLA